MHKNNNKHHYKHNTRGLVARPRYYLNKQQGFGLWEVTMIILVAIFFMFYAIRHYNRMKEQNKIQLVATQAQDLLRAGDRYYDAYCAQNVTGLLAADPNREDPYPNSSDIGIAMDMLQAGNKLTVSSLQTQDKHGNVFLNNTENYDFPFGSGFNIKLIPVANQTKNSCASSPGDSKNSNVNCLGQTETWQVVVSACVNDPEKSLSPELTKSLLNADNVNTTSANCAKGGYELQWISTPHVQQVKQFSQGQVVTNAMRKQNNTMYRYGPWMQQGTHSDKLNAGLNYLCQ